MEDKHVFFVESTDGRKFKMVMKGDFGKLSVAKIHRYLKTYGVPDGQLLTYRGVVLQDDMLGEDFGLASNITLQLRDPAGATAAARPRSGVVEVAPPNRRATMSSQTSMSVSQSGEVVAENAHLKEELNAWKLQVQRLEAQMRQQQDEMHQLRKSSATAAPPRAGSTSAASSYTSVESDPLKNAKDNLEHLSRKLGVPLQFDVNLTCIIGSDEDYTILVSFDPDTERLYMYSTLLHSLPDAPDVRVKLYEVLLEGSLLGREVCGGSLSVSLREGIVVLTTSLVMGHSDSTALCTVMPHFVNTLSRWRSIVHELV